MCRETALRAAVADCAAVSVDLFGTLVSVERPDDPAAAVARELDARGVSVPDDWATAYREAHLDVKEGGELPLADHVAAALASRNEPLRREEIRPTVAEAVRAAFAVEAEPRPGAERLLEYLTDRRPVGVLSNCAVAGLAEHALDSAGIDRERFEAVVTSVDCGWRKPDSHAFTAVADALGVETGELLHIGDDPETDGGISEVGGSSWIVGDGPLARGERWG
ncbi:HAD family hydrolase [Halovenus sp. WSH3]|uniref:HAD family hydrolase n=1 Tax=Halovenus carboxidivorans TaxID=2692199 RepID=A0A6B0SWF5_9EURY|nr:HAD family hydrolase [Halovenus carboxidivorans]MXR50018.1 HAD family hydrolase [Halovenus carboxidivorans]